MYQKTNAMSEIRKTNKDTFWAQAEVAHQKRLFENYFHATLTTDIQESALFQCGYCPFMLTAGPTII